MLNKNKKALSDKEWKDHLGNLSYKSCALFLVLIVFLFVLWLRQTAPLHDGSQNFVTWLVAVWKDSLPFPSFDIAQIVVYFFPISFLFIIAIIHKIAHFSIALIINIWKIMSSFWSEPDKRPKFSCWFDRRNRRIRSFFIGVAFLSWMGYAFCEMILSRDDVAHWFLKSGFVSAIVLLALEMFCTLGWDYLRYGYRGFYKGGKHWYEDEDKYLNDGDYGFLGKIGFNFCSGIDSICIKILNWFRKKLGKKELCKEGDEKKKYKFKSPGELLYQVYILMRYNSLWSRMVYIAIIVFVIKNIWHVYHGEIPGWSSWWNSDSSIGEFIKSSTALRTFLSCPLDNVSFLLLFGLIIEKGPRKAILKSFLYEHLNMVIVILSTVVAILLVLANVAQKELMSGLLFADALFTVVFLIEIALKIFEAGRKFFFIEASEDTTFLLRLDWWNITDAVVVLLSITSIFMLKDEYQLLSGMYAMIILRVVRLLKLLRLLKIFKRYLANLFEGIRHALIRSLPIIIIFAICLTFLGFILYLLSAQLGIGEQFFKDPITSVFSLFQLFTYDGWHTIPESISSECVKRWQGIWWVDTAVRIGFCALVFAGGIVGVALLNSVFVDGMMLRDKSDEDRTRRLNELNRKIEEISTKLDDMEKRSLQR